MLNNDLEGLAPDNSATILTLNTSSAQKTLSTAKHTVENSSAKVVGNVSYPERKSQSKVSPEISFGLMEIPELPYTLPRVARGKAITNVPTGSTIEKEAAKQSWYVEFFFHNAEEERMERFRVTRNLNRIKDPRQKLKNFNILCEAYRIALEGGWNPLDENANARLKKEIIGIDLDEALVLFESYHKAKGTREKSIRTYRSTVNSFIKWLINIFRRIL